MKEMEEEARLRLGILADLGADASLIDAWQTHGTADSPLPYSERIDIKAAEIHPMREEYMEHVAWLEDNSDCVVFQATVEHSIMGDLLDLFVVTSKRDKWEEERAALRNGTARAWVAALDMPASSAWFDIDFEVIDGAFVRVG